MNQFALVFMAACLFVHTGSPWKNRGCKCSGEQRRAGLPMGIGLCPHNQGLAESHWQHRALGGLQTCSLQPRARGWRCRHGISLQWDRRTPVPSSSPRGAYRAVGPMQGPYPSPACQGMEREGSRRGQPEEQRCLSVIPANKILFHYPHYNWFTAFFVYLSIRAAVKWLGKAIA